MGTSPPFPLLKGGQVRSSKISKKGGCAIFYKNRGLEKGEDPVKERGMSDFITVLSTELMIYFTYWLNLN